MNRLLHKLKYTQSYYEEEITKNYKRADLLNEKEKEPIERILEGIRTERGFLYDLYINELISTKKFKSDDLKLIKREKIYENKLEKIDKKLYEKWEKYDTYLKGKLQEVIKKIEILQGSAF